MATNAQKTVDWAEDGEPDLATAIPAPQVSKNKDGTETVVTIFINEDGKKVKRTQRIRRTVVKKKENPRVAERRAWTKIGEEAGKPAGPGDTTTLGENIMFKPSVGFKAGGAQEKAPEEDKKADALKKMQIKCRICSGDHFTTKCPFKDTMAPAGEDAAPADMAAAEGGSDAAGGLGGASGGYVPPHLRKGGAGTTGERMGGKFERDDLATLRVTNVRLSCGNAMRNNTHTNFLSSRFPNSPKRTTSARSSSATAVSLVSSLPRTARPVVPRALLSSLTQTAQMLLGRASAWTATVSAT
jgi:translation initiation factor 3 subunit G